jgi:hypothetical protein
MEIDKEIFQDLVKFYGEAFHLPPLAAKIYAYLIFDFEKKGVCFDHFVEILHASKSSVSSNLNLLLTSGLIKDFTKNRRTQKILRDQRKLHGHSI